MPLIGFENERGERVTFSQCWKLKSFAGVSVEVLYRIYLTQASENRPDGLTVTNLLGCARKAYLQRKTEYYDQPRYLYPLFRGTMIHGMLEDTNKLYKKGGIISEKRYHRLVPGTTINLSGKIDKYDANEETLEDYKTIRDDKVKTLVRSLPEDYIKQANIYAWIMLAHGYVTRKIKIHFFSWVYAYTSGEMALIDASWSGTKWEKIAECPVLTMPQIEDFVVHRVKDITRTEMPPVVSPDQRWMCKACPFKERCWPDDTATI